MILLLLLCCVHQHHRHNQLSKVAENSIYAMGSDAFTLFTLCDTKCCLCGVAYYKRTCIIMLQPELQNC